MRQLFPVVLAALILAGCGAAPTTPAPTAAQAEALEAQRAYKIEDTVGIGPVYGEKLRGVGVTNTDKLLDATASRHKRQKLAEEAGIPYKLVLQWAQKVEIMKIDGIGVRQSNLLAAVGVASLAELAQRNPENLHERLGVANAFKPKFVFFTPSQKTVEKWIKAAKEMPKTISNDQ